MKDNLIMESKISSRSNKKSTGSGDRKKIKSKRKKDKRKILSLKGADSTDVPSPEFDSEVLHDEPLTDQDSSSTPVGQVTKLPLLSSLSTVSLTTQVHPEADDTQPLRSGKTSSGQQRLTSATSLLQKTTTTTTAIVVTGTASAVDGVIARVASLNVKHRSSKNRSKIQNVKSSKAVRTNKVGGNAPQNSRAVSFKTISGQEKNNSESKSNASLRWEFVLEDSDKERERIAEYKVNRRKRYLAAAQAKGLRWALNYNSQITASPTSEDSGVEMGPHSSVAAAYLDYKPAKTIRSVPVLSHRGLQEGLVEC